MIERAWRRGATTSVSTTVTTRSGADAMARQCDILGDGHKVDLGELEGLGLVETRELEQVFDQQAHANGLLLDALHGLCDILGLGEGAHPDRLYE